MKYLISFVILAFFWFTAHQIQLNDNYDIQAYQHLTYSLESAADDAALMVTPESVSDGYIVFDQNQARTVFRQTLGINMKLDPWTLAPDPKSVFRAAPTVLVETFLDYSNTTFPYHYTNATYGIDSWVYGPSIVYVVQVPAPKFVRNAPNFNMTWSTIAAYPDK